MTKPSLLERIRAAYSLSIAMNEDRHPDNLALKTLGLENSFARRFKR